MISPFILPSCYHCEKKNNITVQITVKITYQKIGDDLAICFTSWNNHHQTKSSLLHHISAGQKPGATGPKNAVGGPPGFLELGPCASAPAPCDLGPLGFGLHPIHRGWFPSKMVFFFIQNGDLTMKNCVVPFQQGWFDQSVLWNSIKKEWFFTINKLRVLNKHDGVFTIQSGEETWLNHEKSGFKTIKKGLISNILRKPMGFLHLAFVELNSSCTLHLQQSSQWFWGVIFEAYQGFAWK